LTIGAGKSTLRIFLEVIKNSITTNKPQHKTPNVLGGWEGERSEGEGSEGGIIESKIQTEENQN